MHHKTLAALYSLSALLSKRAPPAAEALIPRACAIEQRLLTEPCADLPTALSLVWAMFLALLRLNMAMSEQLWRKASTFYQEIILTDHPDISPEIRRILHRPSAGSPADDDTFEQTLMHFLEEDHPTFPWCNQEGDRAASIVKASYLSLGIKKTRNGYRLGG